MKTPGIICNMAAMLLLFSVCSIRKEAAIPFNNLHYFLNTAYKAGLIIKKDTTITFRNNCYRTISLLSVTSYIDGYPRWYELFIRPNFDTTNYADNSGDFPIFSDSNDITLSEKNIFAKRDSPNWKSWSAAFKKDSIIYEVHSAGLVYGNCYLIAKKIHAVVWANNKTMIDSIMDRLKDEQKYDFLYSEIQAMLKNYKHDTTKPNNSHQNGCYPGKIIQFPGDTLSPQDSAAFRDCVIRYRRDHGLEGAFIIDTNLLKSLKIPLDPIEEGLKRYYKEFAKKSG